MLSIPRVLLIDDDDTARRDLARMLPRERFACDGEPSAAGALERIGGGAFDVVIAEVHLADMGGLALLERIKRVRPALPVILVSARGTVQEAVEAIKRGAYDYLTKPCAEAELVAAVARAVAGRRRPPSGTFRAPAAPPRGGVELIGAGPAVSRLEDAIDRVAAARWPLRRLTRAYVEQVLAQTGGNKARAAEILDVDLSTLYRWEHARQGAPTRRGAAPPEEPPASST